MLKKTSQKLQEWRDKRKIKLSHLFDEVWYATNNPDIRVTGWSPLDHFLAHGWREGRSPGPNFDVQWYLSAYEDIRLTGQNPLLHYINYGAAEGRLTKNPAHSFENFSNKISTSSFSDNQLNLLLANLETQNQRVQQLQNRVSLLETISSETENVLHARLSDTGKPAPLISVILPTFNRALCIVDAINSVKKQSFTNWELIIVDDGSTDNTETIVSKFLQDKRIKYVKQDNQGNAAARNFGIEKSYGEIISYLDSDNLWYPNYLSAVAEAFLQNPSILVTYAAFVVDWVADARLIFESYNRDKLLQYNFIDTNSFAHRRSAPEKYGVFDTDLDRLVDWDLVLRYTAEQPPHPIPILGTRNLKRDHSRVSEVFPYWPNYIRVKKKWPPIPRPRKPRTVLCAVENKNLNSNQFLMELRCLQRWGIDTRIWSEGVVKPEVNVPSYNNIDLSRAISTVEAEILHIHGADLASQLAAKLNGATPITIRDTEESSVKTVLTLLENVAVKRIYKLAQHNGFSSPLGDRISEIPLTFESELFRPVKEKEYSSIVQVLENPTNLEIDLFVEIARLLPDCRFSLFADFNKPVEDSSLVRPKLPFNVEINFNMPRDQQVAAIHRTGIYLDTTDARVRHNFTATVFFLIDAMASGAYTMTRTNLEPYFRGDSTFSRYQNAGEAAELIRRIQRAPEDVRHADWMKTIEYAHQNHSDELALRPIFLDWCSFTHSGHSD
jgi:glycosyltransferase involved in cell wall biosynthesis